MCVAWCLTVVTGGPSPLSSLANEAGSEREQRGVRLTGQWPSASNSPPRSSPRFHLIDVSQPPWECWGREWKKTAIL